MWHVILGSHLHCEHLLDIHNEGLKFKFERGAICQIPSVQLNRPMQVRSAPQGLCSSEDDIANADLETVATVTIDQIVISDLT